MKISFDEAYLQSGSKSDKDIHHNYGKTYEKLFEPFANKPINLCEVGFYEGESAVLFSYLFKNKDSSFDFIDNTDEYIDFKSVKDRCYDSKRVNFHLFDILKIDKEKEFRDKKFDVVIDDGNHCANYQWKTIDFFKQRLNPGGVIIIEDVRLKNSPFDDPPNYPACISGMNPNDFELIEIPIKDKSVWDNNLLVYRNV